MCFFLSVAKPLHKKISENIEVVKEQMGIENRKGLHFSSVPTAFRQTWITTLAESTLEHQLSVPVRKNLATKDNSTNCPGDNYSLQIFVYSKCNNDGLLSDFCIFQTFLCTRKLQAHRISRSTDQPSILRMFG